MMCCMSLFTRAAATLAATAVVLAPGALALSPADAATNPATPVSSDPFYGLGVTGGVATPPADSTPGQELDSRPVHLSTMVDLYNALQFQAHNPAATAFSIDATQLLYRTQNELGQPSATVTTVLRPEDLPHPVASKGVVAYLSYYDGLSNTCDPSYTLQDDSINGEKAVIGTLLESGYTVTVPDFEGETLDWAAGHEAGWSTLDAIRATESNLDLPATTKVATIGYSGGSFAGEWAAELAPTYAKSVNLIGTAIGGIPANMRSLVNYVNSDADTDRDKWFGVIPAATVSLGRAVGKEAEFNSLLTAEGQADAAYVADKCIGDFADAYPGKHLSDIIKPGVDFLNTPDVKAIVDRNQMGTDGTPTSPLFMFNGNNDGLGDGVMPLADVKALAAKYCDAGLPVQFSEAKGPHATVGNTFMQQGLAYIADRFAGKAAPSNCAPRVQPPATLGTVTVKLKGHSKAGKDVLVVKTTGAAAHTKVKLFAKGHKKAIAHGKLDKHGKLTLTVADHNGAKVTRYQAVVSATATTAVATSKVVKLR